MKTYPWTTLFIRHSLYRNLKNQTRKMCQAIYYGLPISYEFKIRVRAYIKRFTKLSITQNKALGGSRAPNRTFSTPQGRDLILFSIDPNDAMQRSQDLIQYFAKTGMRVFFISNQFINSTNPGYKCTPLNEQVEIYQITLHVKTLLSVDNELPTSQNLAQMMQSITQLMLDFIIISNIAVIQHPNWFLLSKRLPNSLRIFDCLDEIMMTESILCESDLVILTSDCLHKFTSHPHKNVIKFHNPNAHISELGKSIMNLSMPKISVIVLTYNNIKLTKVCLNSLLFNNDYPNLEIIIVDNASTDETPKYLVELIQQNPHIKLILNDTNLGFAAGNNLGIQAATGDYLIILNNDTIVTPGAFLTMMRHFQSDSEIGLIGPVTNNIGNEAKVEIHYTNKTTMYPNAFNCIIRQMGNRIYLHNIAFFCVMMPRRVFEQVGLLDENFGRGFFEDDDYCRRIEQKNWSIACAEDAFIHHELSASFNQLKRKEIRTLFQQNKAYYESKWGKWQPHKHRSRGLKKDDA